MPKPILALTALLALPFQATPIGGPPADDPRPHRSFRFVYEAALPAVPDGAQVTRLWIPVPLDTPDQTIRDLAFEVRSGEQRQRLAASTPGGLQDGSSGELSWTFRDLVRGQGRSACVETAGAPIEVRLEFDVTRYETTGGGEASPEELDALTRPTRMIPLDGKVAAIAAALETPQDPRQAARALYDHTLERMRYDKPADRPGWGRGDAEWACDARFGNCTDFHSYFMGLARTKGLPARFEMGFPVPAGDAEEAEVGGYHCWAYVWIEGHGWLPVDISEADKQPGKSDFFFGRLDADRVTMSGGRDVVLEPAPAAGPLNYFVYPHAEVDGEPIEATKLFRRRLR